jgi:drug efflux transport system permease protein
MWRRLWSIVRKEFIQIIRDPRTLAITFVMPVIMMLLLGYAATTDVRNVPMAVFDQDRSVQSRDLLEAFAATDYFERAYDADSEQQIEDLIGSGAARTGLIIPPDFGETIEAGGQAEVAFLIDGSDPSVAQTSLQAATLIGQQHAIKLVTERLAAHGQAGLLSLPMEVRTAVWYNPDLISAYYMVPALIGIILLFVSTILTSTAIVRERERGTIEQLLVTPIRSWELLVGKIAPYVLIAFLDTIEILIVGTLIFRVPINGSIPLLLALSALFLVTTLGIGLFISTIAHTQQEAMMTALFFLLPNIFLSGFFFPIAAMPQILQWITYLIPLRYFLDIVRGIVLKGVGIEALWPDVIALTIFGIVIMGAAARRFRKSLD